MPRITQIKKQKRENRVSVYLDNKFGFGIDLENFVKLKLKVEQELSLEEIGSITQKADYQKYYEKVLRYGMIRPRSEKEFDNYFKRKQVPDVFIPKIKAKLESFGLLSDTKFATWWVEQRQSFRPRAKRALVYELSSKGVDREVINKILGETKLDEIKMIKDVLDKKRYKWERLPKNETYKKMTEYLARKGYSWENIKKALSGD